MAGDRRGCCIFVVRLRDVGVDLGAEEWSEKIVLEQRVGCRI